LGQSLAGGKRPVFQGCRLDKSVFERTKGLRSPLVVVQALGQARISPARRLGSRFLCRS